MCSQLKVHKTRQRKKRADKARLMLLRDKSPRFGGEQQVCAARTPLTKQVNMGRLTAAEGRAHGVFTDGIKAPKLYTLGKWAGKFRNTVLSHALIWAHIFLIFVLYIVETNSGSPHEAFTDFFIVAALTDKTGMFDIPTAIECVITAALFSWTFLATQEVELLLPADPFRKLSSRRLSEWHLNTELYQSETHQHPSADVKFNQYSPESVWQQ